MNPDEEAEAALREAYGKRLGESFAEFCLSFFPPEPGLSKDALARLFASHGSFPAYSVWRNRVMGTTKADLEAYKADVNAGYKPREASLGSAAPADRAASAYAAWKKGALESAAYSSLVEAMKVKVPSAVYQGRGGRFLISKQATQQDFEEAFR